MRALLSILIAGAIGAQQPTTRVAERDGAVVIEYGPVDLPASTPHDRMQQPPTLTVRLPADGWLRGLEVDLVDSAGHALPRRLLHHLNVISPDRRDLFSNVMLRLGAAGAETSPITLPRIIGVRAKGGDSVFITLMFHNPTDIRYEHVTLRARM